MVNHEILEEILQRHQCHQVYLRQIRNNHIRSFIGLESSRLH